jgi:NAD(P)-dependent dehydrogenase (short-subunit alcohol dehydrogenase family)
VSQFEGKRYVVTGAASGIGHATAEKLLAGGAEVISLDRNTPTAAVTWHIEVDLANPRSIDAALEQLEGDFDGLMNIAGIPGTAPPDLVLAVNSLAVRHLTEAFFERLRPGGTVTIVSSTAGFGWPQRLDTIRDLLATDTFEDGAAWFKTHPQQGNAYNFSKEVTTVYTMSMGLCVGADGLSHQCGAAGSGGDADLGRFRGVDGQGQPRRCEGTARPPRHAGRHRRRGAVPGL